MDACAAARSDWAAFRAFCWSWLSRRASRSPSATLSPTSTRRSMTLPPTRNPRLLSRRARISPVRAAVLSNCVICTPKARTSVASAGGGVGCSHPRSTKLTMIAVLAVHGMVSKSFLEPTWRTHSAAAPSEDFQGVVRDHALLVGRDDVNPGPTCPGRNQACARRIDRRVCRLIQFDAEPAGFPADPRAERGGVLSDAGREHDGVQALHRNGQRSEGEAGPIDKVIQSQLGAWILAGEQITDVVADAGQTLEPAIVIEQVLDGIGGHALLREQVEDDAGVELPGACAHGQAVQRREAHGAVDT